MNKKNFTINDLERLSGVKAHTLRIWELRYALMQPARGPNNFRLYTLDELQKILNIALLKRNGYRVSRLSKIHPADIEKEVGQLANDCNKWQKAINNLTINMYTLEPESFERALDALLATWPIEVLAEKIIYPFLTVTSLLWTGNKLCEEHLVVTAIRKKLMLSIESAGLITKENKPVVLFIPDTKQLDLGLLYCNFFLKKRGIHVLYMGNDVTIENLKSILKVHPATYLFTYLQPNHHFPIDELLEYMNQCVPDAKLIVGEYSFAYATPSATGNLVQMKYADALNYLHASSK